MERCRVAAAAKLARCIAAAVCALTWRAMHVWVHHIWPASYGHGNMVPCGGGVHGGWWVDGWKIVVVVTGVTLCSA